MRRLLLDAHLAVRQLDRLIAQQQRDRAHPCPAEATGSQLPGLAHQAGESAVDEADALGGEGTGGDLQILHLEAGLEGEMAEAAAVDLDAVGHRLVHPDHLRAEGGLDVERPRGPGGAEEEEQRQSPLLPSLQ